MCHFFPRRYCVETTHFYGSQRDDGTWNGMVGMVNRQLIIVICENIPQPLNHVNVTILLQ